MAKKKFWQLSRRTWIWIGFGLTVAIIFGSALYFLFWYEEVPVSRIADDFCSCATKSEVIKGKFELNREGFQFASEITPCFGELFRHYDDYLTYEEELEYVELVRDKIFKTCPEKLQAMFK